MRNRFCSLILKLTIQIINMKYILSFFLLLSMNFIFAQPSEPILPAIEKATHGFRLHYNMQTPAMTFELPEVLKEISGLSLTPDESKLVAIQDEDGDIYMINKTTGEVERDYNFYKEGDYEGVEMVGHSVFVTKSNGKIYEVHDFGGEHQQTIKFTTSLNKAYDVEGLAYDKKNERLLMSCKAVGDPSEAISLEKSIYAFDLKTRCLIEKPVYTLRLKDFLHFLENNQHIHRCEKMEEHFSEDPTDFPFSSSAIAINPRTENIYILSSKGKMMSVLSPTGELLHVEKLEKSIHCQPEGICFAKDGTMYVSNEGKNGVSGRIYRFDYEE